MRGMGRLLAATLLVATAGVAALTARSPVPGPTPSTIRGGVERALPLLQSSADTWFARRQCASCHHQGLGLLLAAGYAGARASVNLLLARGVPVDRPATVGNLPGATALSRALMLGDLELASALASRGASVGA